MFIQVMTGYTIEDNKIRVSVYDSKSLDFLWSFETECFDFREKDDTVKISEETDDLG